ncbi:NAD-dependent epimerase/dehydratase family protein [[Pseudomonas] boreopolis]|uniref:NAD-dependent epimerase/dehydratase family protein n=1 Tax=Xanthomonas boreopolis TaxID=86183 RepID=UPI003D46A98D
MIIGSGLIARAFAPRFGNERDVLLFASGVSNSQERDPAAFMRERQLLQEAISQRRPRLVYFGSCNVANSAQTSPYFEHKRQMEQLVMGSSGGLVLRLPQVVGRTANPHTLTNFLRDRILAGERFTVWRNAQRNLIDIDDVVAIATELINSPTSQAIPIASPHTLTMPEIIALFEQVLGKKALFDLEDRGDAMQIDAREALSIAHRLELDLGPDYPRSLIEKYYGASHDS